jgi:TorA maturation chaperone TorD
MNDSTTGLDKTERVTASTSLDGITTDPRLRAFGILSHVAEGRRRVYGWLAFGFYPPDTALVRALTTRHMVEEIEAATAWLGQDQERLTESLRDLGAFLRPRLANLEAEYDRLFGRSIERVVACEAAYRWRDARDLSPKSNSIVHALQQHYQQFSVAPLPGQEDHVAVELEFLSLLCQREAANWAAGAGEAARLLRRQQRSFLDDHLGRWLSEFCQRVLERTPACFYGPLATLADSWLSLEHGPGYLTAVRK